MLQISEYINGVFVCQFRCIYAVLLLLFLFVIMCTVVARVDNLYKCEVFFGIIRWRIGPRSLSCRSGPAGYYANRPDTHALCSPQGVSRTSAATVYAW